MSSIEKMRISGIRSFSPDMPGTIEFYTPLTVIVGQNGAGKTTIIECLKFATTGDPPPSTGRGGQGFVHDPKVANEREVKAQIKLRFKNVTKKTLTLTRSMSLTVSQKQQTFKTLDSVLQVDHGNGEKSSVSNKCGDINKEMNRQLGVSKAVLENVIFCHQEDSLWPLSEPAALKKKFDEIFSATRYMKALEQLKNLKKEQASEVKVDKERLNNIAFKKEKAAEIANTLAKTLRKIEESKVDVQDIEKEIKGIEEELAKRQAQLAKIDDIAKKVNDLMNRKDFKMSEHTALGNEIQLFSESDVELMDMLKKYRASMESEGGGKDALERERRGQELEIKRLQDLSATKSTERGKLLGQAEIHKRNLEERDKIILETNDKHKIDSQIRGEVVSGTLSSPKAAEFNSKLVAKLKDVEGTISRKKAEAAKRVETTQREINALEIELTRSQDEITRNERTKEENRRELESLQRQIDDIQASQLALDDLKERHSKAGELHAKLKRDLDISVVEGEIRDLEAGKKSADTLVGHLAGMLKEVSTQTESSTRASIKKGDLRKNEQLVEKILEENRAEIERSVGRVSNVDDLEMSVHTALKIHQQKRRELDALLQDRKLQLSKIQAELDMNTADLAKKNRDLAEKGRKVDEVASAVMAQTEGEVSDQSIPSMLERTTSLLQTSQRKALLYEVISDVYERFLSKASEEHKCPLCDRDFPQRDHLNEFLASLTDTLNKIPESFQQATAIRDKFEELVKAIQAVRPDWDSRELLVTKDIPTLDNIISRLQDKRAILEREISDHQLSLQKMTHDEQVIQNILKVAEKISSLLAENKRLSREIEEINSKLSNLNSTKSLDELKEEYEAASANSSKCAKQIDQLRLNLHDIMEKIRASEKAMDDLQHQHSLQEQKLKQKGHLMEKKSQLNTNLQDLEKRTEYLRPKLEDFEKKIRASMKQEEDIKRQQALEETLAVEDHRKIQADVYRLQSIFNEVESFERGGGEVRLAQISREISELEEKKRTCLAKSQECLLRLNEIQNKVSKIEEMERKVKQNLDYRKLKEEIRRLEGEIADTLSEMSSLPSKETLLKERQHFTDKLEDAKRTKHRAEGGSLELTEQAKRWEQALRSDYHNIEEIYKTEMIKLKTTEMSVTDLEKYSKAIDIAIMKYHSMKMQEINKIIRELWVKTYQGLDIDAIEIRSEDEVNAARSYNYRVVMIKGDTTLDMRGRCSAGQKVLASIIIRLALAETFGLHCGVFALDEPTTNLDRDNIESLAESLNEIIKTRMKQSNFQMIVITHDEEFVSMLGRGDHLSDYYWRVSKNAQQQSIIERNAANGDRDEYAPND